MEAPILEIIEELKSQLSKNPIVILQAPPGAGKSTVLPLHLLDADWLGNQKIVMLEPRRLAARSVAMRMSTLKDEQVGGIIGYRVRFESKVSNSTKIEVVTEGILTRLMQNDSALEGIGLVIFDEFHERSLQADLALALCLQIQTVLRDDLRILIMSATLDSERLSSFLNAPVVTSKGKQFPVNLIYTPPEINTTIALQMARAIRKAFYEQSGDILAFFPGAGEILKTMDLLEKEDLSARLHPLYGDLSFAKQQEAILPDPRGMRKIVLATSIAETSLTIEGITVVIDCGYSRVPRFDPRSGFTGLDTIQVTKDAADQRAGRAGRLAPGVCYRLWKEGQQGSLVPNRIPEVLEADLVSLVLETLQWGIRDVHSLTWITPPPVGAVQQAQELLVQLEAVEDGAITEKGRQMLRLPTHPRIAHMLLASKESVQENVNLPALAADIAALLEEKDPLPKESGADLSLRITMLRRWRNGDRVPVERSRLERIEKMASTWRAILKAKIDNETVSDHFIGRLLMAAFPERIARQVEKHSERYKLVTGRSARLFSNDPLSKEPWLAVAHLDAGTGEAKIFLAAPLHEGDLLAQAKEQTRIDWDDGRQMVVGFKEKRVGALLLSAKPLVQISQQDRERVICRVIREGGLKILGWEKSLEQWQARTMSLKKWRPDEKWPDVSDEALLETLESWLAPFLIDIYKLSEVERLSPAEILPTILPYELNNKLKLLAPERLTVPTGSDIKVNYSHDGSLPTMEVRLQEVFGMAETPTVNEGRIKVILHLLSPGYKPVQVTQDLKSFWDNTYAEVRKELRARYPKHSWPEDPWTAEAVRGVKRKK